MADQNDYQFGDSDNNIFRKILNRLSQFIGGGSPTVTLTASDLEIGAVEIKNSSDDTRAIVTTSAPGVGDPGLVVRIAGGASSGGDGALLDGVNPTIKATVFDLTSSNPVATQAVDANGDPVTTQPVSVASLPLPAGASTEATLATRASQATLATRASEATLASIDGKVVAVDTDNVTIVGTVAVSAAALPLPAGASTEATLASLNAKVTAVNTGAVTISAALPAGNNNIGDVDVTTLPAIPAGNNNIGDVDVASVPAPLNVVGGGTEAAALRVTVANDSTGVLSVDDNGASLTVDTTQLPAALVGGRLDVVVGAALPSGTNNIGDVDVLTVPAPLNVAGGGTEAAAQRVTIASDSTGVLSVDDNGSSLTVDGTVAANQGTPASAALVGAWPTVGLAPAGIAENIYVATDVAMGKGASRNYLSIYNADAALKVDILLATVVQEDTAAVTGLLRGYRLFRFTTAHSGGTSLTPIRVNTAMGVLDADITARSNNLTIGGAETMALGICNLAEEETSGSPRQVLWNWKEHGICITLNTNQGIVIQQDATAGTGVISASIVFRVR